VGADRATRSLMKSSGMWRAPASTELDPHPWRSEIIFGQCHGDTFGAHWPRPSIALGAADKASAKTVDLDEGTTAVGAVT
jgi:hypothetical protein